MSVINLDSGGSNQPLSRSFEFGEVKIRVVEHQGEPWFVAGDVCAVLGLANVGEALRSLDEDDISSADVIDSIGRRQQAKTVSEPGLYGLIFASRRPEAKAFRKWVTGTVLPEIRKTGGYSVPARLPSHKETAIALVAALEENERIDAERQREAAKAAALEAQAEKDAPRLAFANIVMTATNSISMNETAKLLGLGRNKMMRKLREWGLLMKDNAPYQSEVDAGHFTTHESPWTHPKTGKVKAVTVTDVTQKGLDYLRRRFGKEVAA